MYVYIPYMFYIVLCPKILLIKKCIYIPSVSRRIYNDLEDARCCYMNRRAHAPVCNPFSAFVLKITCIISIIFFFRLTFRFR